MGFDTVAIGGVTAAPILLLKSEGWGKRTRQYQTAERGGISLFVSQFWGFHYVRLQTSLPHLVYGHNFEPVPVRNLQRALELFLAEARHWFPELSDVPLEMFAVRRTDIAFDLPVDASPSMERALNDCHLSNRLPGFTFEGPASNSRYSKDWRGKRANTYRSMIAYAKRHLPTGGKGLRFESRFGSAYLRRKFKGRMTLESLVTHGQEILLCAWEYIDNEFSLLRPHNERSLRLAIQNAPTAQREFLSDFGYLAREVPLKQVWRLLCGTKKIDTRILKQYGVGFGDAEIPELKLFAEIREAITSWLSCPYKKEVERRDTDINESLLQSTQQEIDRADSERTCNCNQLNDRHASLTALNFPHRHRVPTQPGRKLPLRKSLLAPQPRNRSP